METTICDVCGGRCEVRFDSRWYYPLRVEWRRVFRNLRLDVCGACVRDFSEWRKARASVVSGA